MYLSGFNAPIYITEKYFGLKDSFSYKIFSLIFWVSIIGNFSFLIVSINFFNKESQLEHIFILINKIIICMSIIISFYVFIDCYKIVKIRKHGIFLFIFLLLMMIIGISLPSLII